ncbi:hypothetical protein QR680_015292 [Steinernema hermaphroditum]|uniref:EGF-like domain-containing protein n=1 Tax=Steinernema hermaphroditum TaxID=289476 RepID=A0AA39LKK4_9BILA|nr:hypothetical protein QR680_015292 [Steinernema hermaphroditum]
MNIFTIFLISSWIIICTAAYPPTPLPTCTVRYRGLKHDCYNNATCLDKCICAEGFTGRYCEQRLDLCMNIDCGYGQCAVLDGSIHCECPEGFEGLRCEKDIDECEWDLHDCQNGAKCVNLVGFYRCECAVSESGEPLFDGYFCQRATGKAPLRLAPAIAIIGILLVCTFSATALALKKYFKIRADDTEVLVHYSAAEDDISATARRHSLTAVRSQWVIEAVLRTLCTEHPRNTSVKRTLPVGINSTGSPVKMHFVVGICLVLLPFLVAYLIYYVIDLVYLMYIESCAKKGDTEAPAEISFSNLNVHKDVCGEGV